MNFQKIEFELSAGRADQLPRATLPEIVFSGRSNVGKSSLINKLVNRKSLARVSATPGKTATINFFRMDECRLVDLPGYGYAKVSKSEKDRWARLVEGYFAAGRKIALVVQLVDMRHEPTQDDVDMINFLIDAGLPIVVALTKADKLNRTDTEKQTALFEELFQEAGVDFVPFSSVKGTGLSELQSILEQAVENQTEREVTA